MPLHPETLFIVFTVQSDNRDNSTKLINTRKGWREGSKNGRKYGDRKDQTGGGPEENDEIGKTRERNREEDRGGERERENQRETQRETHRDTERQRGG